nr:hypothetical protein [Betaproteobacteria bacterium]
MSTRPDHSATSTASTEAAGTSASVFILDGYLPAKTWPELKQDWAMVLSRFDALECWEEASVSPRVLALEHWLCRQLGWTPQSLEGLACWLLPENRWLDPTRPSIVLTPCHFYIRLDHVGVSALHDEPLSWDQATELQHALNDDLQAWSQWFGSNIGIEVLEPMHWLLRFDALVDLQGCSLALAEGLNVEQYLAQGSQTRNWRRLLNQVQMLWYEHPVNQARAASGYRPVNALWLGGSTVPGLQKTKRCFKPRSQLAFLMGLERFTQGQPGQICDELSLMRLRGDQLGVQTAQQGLKNLLSTLESRPASKPFELLISADHAWEHYRLRSGRAQSKPGLVEGIRRWFQQG